MLDAFSVCRVQLNVATTTLGMLQKLQTWEAGIQAARRAVATALVGNSDAQLEGDIEENLRALMPWSQRTAPLHDFLGTLAELDHHWRYDTTGRVDNPPSVPASRRVELTAGQMTDLKRLAFVTTPPKMLCPALVRDLRARLFEGSASSTSPTCIITVGAPGAGKTYVSHRAFVPSLAERGLGPDDSRYITIDPDYWLAGVCGNDNTQRNLANYLTMESFLLAVKQRRHIVFDGTGKSLENTCGRIISRLRGYRVHICIVLASYNRCLHNIAERKKRSGRDVPTRFVRETFAALQEATSVYVRRQPEIAEQTTIYVNDDLAPYEAATVRDGEGLEDALAVLDKYLQIPDADG